MAPSLQGTQRPLQMLISSHSTPMRWALHSSRHPIIHICDFAKILLPSASPVCFLMEFTSVHWGWLVESTVKERTSHKKKPSGDRGLGRSPLLPPPLTHRDGRGDPGKQTFSLLRAEKPESDHDNVRSERWTKSWTASRAGGLCEMTNYNPP